MSKIALVTVDRRSTAIPPSLLCIAFLLLIAALPLHARLGETETETIARYGPLTEAFNPGQQNCAYRTLIFIRDRYITEAIFIGPACQAVIFRKADKSPFMRDDLDLILTANSNGQKWLPTPLASVDVFWDRPDGAVARYDTEAHALAICSAAYLLAQGSRSQAEQQKELERF